MSLPYHRADRDRTAVPGVAVSRSLHPSPALPTYQERFTPSQLSSRLCTFLYIRAVKLLLMMLFFLQKHS